MEEKITINEIEYVVKPVRWKDVKSEFNPQMDNMQDVLVQVSTGMSSEDFGNLFFGDALKLLSVVTKVNKMQDSKVFQNPQ